MPRFSHLFHDPVDILLSFWTLPAHSQALLSSSPVLIQQFSLHSVSTLCISFMPYCVTSLWWLYCLSFHQQTSQCLGGTFVNLHTCCAAFNHTSFTIYIHIPARNCYILTHEQITVLYWSPSDFILSALKIYLFVLVLIASLIITPRMQNTITNY